MKTKKITKKEVLNDYSDINIQLHAYWLAEQEDDGVTELQNDQDYFLDQEHERWCEEGGNEK
jgi:hypothetical protein